MTSALVTGAAPQPCPGPPGPRPQRGEQAPQKSRYPASRHAWVTRTGRMCDVRCRSCQVGQRLVEVLVAASGQADDDRLAVEGAGARERMRGLERGDDPLGLREPLEGGEGFVVRRRQVLDAA